MGEKFLVTSALNGTELLRSMALRGMNTFAFRVLSAADMAETALICCGNLPEGHRLPSDEQRFVIWSLMKQVRYFAGPLSLQDADRLCAVLNDIRLRFASDEASGLRDALPRGEFTDKNAALLEVYGLYMNWLDENERFDDICLIRYALEQASEMTAEFVLLDAFPLSPLEEALVMRLSGGTARTVSLSDLFGCQALDALRLDSLMKVYGPVNEVDRVIRDILESGAPLDRCVVAVSDPTVYGQLFFDIATEKGVPVSFGCGISVMNSRPAGLLGLWEKWNGAGFNGVDALRNMILSDTFNRSVLTEELNRDREEGQAPLRKLVGLAGNLRLKADAADNAERIAAWEATLSESAKEREYLEPLRRLGHELGLSCEAFLSKYACIRQHPDGGPLDKSALTAILNMLNMARRFPDLITLEEMIPMALEQSVESTLAEPGKLFVTAVSGALSTQRDHLYVLGLSADKFPGKPRENALMLDSDWELLPCPETAPTSRNRVEGTLERFLLLDRLAAALGIDVHMYWPDYDPSALKELIPSSVVYRLQDACPNAASGKEGYFPAVYSDAYAAGRLYLEEGRIIPGGEGTDIPADAGIDPEGREWSPNAIDTWFNCKRQFMYQFILGLDGTEEDDPMTVISRKEFGKLAHLMMEILAAERPDREEFRDMAASKFDDFMKSRPPMDRHAADLERRRFLKMMDLAWREDPRREVVFSEDETRGVHPCGLKLSGRPDRVEALEDGNHLVVDFKTGRKITQEANDPKTCRQTMIYAWMLRQAGIPVTGCEYRYLRNNRIIPCEVNPLTVGALEEDLIRFRDGVESGDFACEDGYSKPVKASSDTCKYCAYKAACEADKKREEARG